RRLAIIDLESGAQPLENETGSVRVVCNGEIYNYRELRRALEASGHRFRTVSDCETIVHLYEEHGPDAVARLHGMFALAIWDRTLKRLVLARDRLGIKPLFYSAGAQGFGFVSEIKALLAARMTRREVHPDGLLHYLSCGYVPGTDTIYRDVHRLAPGELLVPDPRGLHRRPYWTLPPGAPLRSRSPARPAGTSRWCCPGTGPTSCSRATRSTSAKCTPHGRYVLSSGYSARRRRSRPPAAGIASRKPSGSSGGWPTAAASPTPGGATHAGRRCAGKPRCARWSRT